MIHKPNEGWDNPKPFVEGARSVVNSATMVRRSVNKVIGLGCATLTGFLTFKWTVAGVGVLFGYGIVMGLLILLMAAGAGYLTVRFIKRTFA